MIEDPFDPTRQTTLTTRQDAVTPEKSLRVPGLVIAGHGDPRRVGEEVALPHIASGATVGLSRLEPAFAMPDEEVFRPLDDAHLSRSPIQLGPGSERGSVILDRAGSPTTVQADGEEIKRAHTFSSAEVARGVVLVLGGRVTLILQPVDPVPVSIPHYGLVGESAAAVRLRQEIRSAAQLEIPVLLRGETGTGKEIVAQALHEASTRCHGPYRTVSLAALPASLAASALFGVIRGAYTGADHNKVGFFQSAQGGTLFLDEIGEAPIEVQVLLLRALETQEIQPLGSVDTIPIDVRVIAATDTNLESAIAEGHFRAPLLHRLAGYEIHLPPLRGRRDDVARLLLHFVHQESESLAADDASADPAGRPWPPAALTARLLVYDWPGNVRQLRNVVRRLVIARRESMDDHELNRLVDQLLATAPLRVPMTESPSKAPSHPATVIDRKIELPLHGPSRRSVEVSEVELLAALEAHRWQLTPTATALGVSRSTLYRLIEGSSRIRKASELESLEISQALEHASDNINAAALELRVSPQGLKRRIKALGPT